MAKIDTILANGDVNTGAAAPRMGFGSVDNLDAGAQSLARGADSLVGGIRQMQQKEYIAQRRLEMKQEYDNDLWAQGQFTNAQRDWTQWSNDVQKSGSEDVVKDFDSKFPDYTQNLMKQAPNPDAAQRLQLRMNELGSHTFDNALKIEGANRAQNTVNSFQNMLSTSTDTISQDPESYSKIQDNLRNFVNKASDMQRIPPNTAIKLHDGINNLAVVAAESTLAKDPDRAEEIMKGATGIEWQRRKVVEGEIERAKGSTDALYQYQQKQMFSSNLDSLETTGQGVPGFDPQKFATAMGGKGDKTDATYLSIMDKINTAKQTYVGVNSLQGKSPGEINQILEKADPTNTPGDPAFSSKLEVFNKMAQAADRQQKLFNKDPFSYSRQDPIVNKAWSMVEDLPQNALPDLRQKLTQQALSASVNWQTGKGVAQAQTSVMPEAAATQMAQKINGGDLKTVQDTLDQMKQTYGNYYPMAFRDMVKLPEGQRVDAATQIVALQSGKPFLSDFLAAVRTPDKDMKLETDDKKLLDQKLLTDPSMMSFKAAMLSANPSAAPMTGEYSDAIGKYATALYYRGKVKDIPSAVKMASDMVIGSAYGFTQLGGVPLAVKRQQGKDNYTDDDIKQIGGALKQWNQQIDPNKVDTSKFSFPDGISDGEKIKSIGTTVKNDSFWVTNPQNDGAQLYMNGANGTSAPIKWKDGRPVEGKFNVLLNLAKTNGQIDANSDMSPIASQYGPF